MFLSDDEALEGLGRDWFSPFLGWTGWTLGDFDMYTLWGYERFNVPPYEKLPLPDRDDTLPEDDSIRDEDDLTDAERKQLRGKRFLFADDARTYLGRIGSDGFIVRMRDGTFGVVVLGSNPRRRRKR